MDKIGKRAAEAILKKIGSGSDYHKELDRLNLTRQSLHQWETGKHTPSAKVLRRMALAGYDLVWILTGGKQ